MGDHLDSSFRGPFLFRAVAREIRHQHRVFWRNPVAICFTLALPVLTLPLLQAINQGAFVDTPAASGFIPDGFTRGDVEVASQYVTGLRVPFAQYLAPMSAAYAVAIACMAHLANRTAIARDLGILKRVRGTPLPASVYVAGLVGASITLAVLMAVAAVGVGVVAWDVQVIGRLLPGASVALLVGVVTFCALGLGLGTLVPNSTAAPAITYSLLVPLGMLSSVFFPPEIAPDWMHDLGSALPLQPFGQALFAGFSPDTASPGILWGELAKVAAWGAVGVVVTIRGFRRDPVNG